MPDNKTNPEPEYIKVRKGLKYLIWDGGFWSIMDGFTANFIVPYAIFLNSSNLLISLLASVPDLLASFFQLLAIKINETFKSRKTVIVLGVFLQACIWIPIMLIPRFFSQGNQAYALIIFYSAFLMMATFNGPLWRGMVGDLVPEHERGTYFGKRNRVIALVSFLAGLSAGGILQHFSKINPLIGFSILFGVASVARIISGIFLSMVYEKPVFKSNIHRYPEYKYTLVRFLRDLTKSDYGKFVLFICLFRISVAICGPFFAVYELKHLGFTYMQYILLLSAEIIASVLSLGLWGKLNDERGSKAVIMFSGILIPFIPLGYLVSANYFYLFAVSMLSGAAWAGFNLAIGNFMFDAASPQERVRYASYYQLFNGIAVFIGALGGGLLLNALPDTVDSILAIFLLSGVGRLAVVILLFPALREMRLVELPFGNSFFKYPLIIKPRQRFVQDPFDYYLAYPSKPKKSRPVLYIDESLKDNFRDPDEERRKNEHIKKFLERHSGK